MILIGAAFGRRADATRRPGPTAETAQNVWRLAISCEKSGFSARDEAPDARRALLQGHQNR